MDTNEHKKLYSEGDIRTMRIAEKARLPGKNRMKEIKNFARLSGYNRFGIVYCIAFRREASRLKAALESKFEVFLIDCYNGRISSAELLGKDSPGVSCNPVGQAEYLAQHNTELNISFGLCMGHNIIFNQKSKAPVTKLIVKDREHRHNPYKEFDI